MNITGVYDADAIALYNTLTRSNKTYIDTIIKEIEADIKNLRDKRNKLYKACQEKRLWDDFRRSEEHQRYIKYKNQVKGMTKMLEYFKGIKKLGLTIN